jgi:hypothetical protein
LNLIVPDLTSLLFNFYSTLGADDGPHLRIRAVVPRVISWRQDLQVVDVVVGGILILVVNVLPRL